MAGLNLRLAALLGTSGLALASCWAAPALAASVPLSGLGARGAIACTDQIPNLPAGASALQASTACDVQNYVLTSVNGFTGVDPTGVADSTTGLLAAIATGRALTCNGLYKTSAALTGWSNGQSLTGVGPTGFSGGPTANRCDIKPTSAVTTAISVAGTSTSAYLTNVSISNLTIDMSNMSDAATTYAINLGLTWGDNVANIQVLSSGAKKRSLGLQPGAYIINATLIDGGIVECNGQGGAQPGGDPTTLTLNSPNITGLVMSYCANVKTNGGAVQEGYSTSGSTVEYIAPGNTNLLGFYATTAALWAVTGGTPAGLYVAYSDSTFDSQGLVSSGTDWEVQGVPPVTCSITGSSWAFGTYNDGTHGCLPVVMAFKAGANTFGCQFDGPSFGAMYLWQPYVYPGCTVHGFSPSSGNVEDLHQSGHDIFNGNLILSNGSAFYGYSDMAQTNQTLLLDASNGQITYKGGYVTPGTDGNYLNFYNAAGSLLGGITSSVTANASRMWFQQFQVFNGATLTAGMSGYNGSVWGYFGTFQPATNGVALQVNNAAGATVLMVTTNATAGLSTISTPAKLSAGALDSTPIGGTTPAAAAVTTLAAATSVSVAGKLQISATAPTYLSGFSTGTPSIVGSTTAAFTVTIGATPGGTGVLTMPAAATGWVCLGTDRTTAAGTIRQTASTTTTSTFALASTVASDALQLQCMGY